MRVKLLHAALVVDQDKTSRLYIAEIESLMAEAVPKENDGTLLDSDSDAGSNAPESESNSLSDLEEGVPPAPPTQSIPRIAKQAWALISLSIRMFLPQPDSALHVGSTFTLGR